MGLLLTFAALVLYVSVPLPTPSCLDYWWCVIVPSDCFHFILSPPPPPPPPSVPGIKPKTVHIRQALTTLLRYSYGFWNSHMVIICIYGRVSMVFQLFPKCLFVLCIIDWVIRKGVRKVCLLKLSGGKTHWIPHFQLVMKFHCLKTMVLRSHRIISYLCRASGSYSGSFDTLRQKSRVLQLLNWWLIAWGLIGPWGCTELQWRNTWWQLLGTSLRQ